jgi:hypothetical protein
MPGHAFYPPPFFSLSMFAILVDDFPHEPYWLLAV